MKSKSDIFLKYSSILLSAFIFLVPISLIAGPAIPNILITISSVYFLTISFFFKLGKYYQNNFFKIFIIFWFFIIVNSLFSDYPYISLINSVSYLRFGIFAIAIAFAINTNDNFFNFFFYIYGPIFLLLIFDTFFQKYYGYNIVGFFSCGDAACGRYSGFFRDEWILGSYIFHFFSLFSTLVVFSKFIKSEYKILLILFLFLTALFAVYFTGERSSFIAMSIFLLIFIFSITNYIKYHIIRKYNTYLIIFASILILTFVNLLVKNNRYNSIYFTMTSSVSKYSTIFVYKDLYSTAFKMFLDRPLTGQGNQVFRHKCSESKYKTGIFGCNNHPHNYFFQILAENGIIGFCFIIFFLYCLIRFSFKNFLLFYKKNDQVAFCLFMLSCNLLLCFLPFLPSGNFYTSVTGVFIFMKIGILYGIKYDKKIRQI